MNDLPGDAGLPPGVRQADIDDPDPLDEETGWPASVAREYKIADELEGENE